MILSVFTTFLSAFLKFSFYIFLLNFPFLIFPFWFSLLYFPFYIFPFWFFPFWFSLFNSLSIAKIKSQKIIILYLQARWNTKFIIPKCFRFSYNFTYIYTCSSEETSNTSILFIYWIGFLQYSAKKNEKNNNLKI